MATGPDRATDITTYRPVSCTLAERKVALGKLQRRMASCMINSYGPSTQIVREINSVHCPSSLAVEALEGVLQLARSHKTPTAVAIVAVARGTGSGCLTSLDRSSQRIGGDTPLRTIAARDHAG